MADLWPLRDALNGQVGLVVRHAAAFSVFAMLL